MSVKPIREGFHTLTPYLMVEDAGAVADFLQKAFDAELLERFERPDGSVMHMEMRIGDSMLMLGEPMGEFGPMPASVYVYSEDCDGTYKRALKAGGTSVMEPTDMRHAGERYGGIKGTGGNLWWIATHIEDLTPEEQSRRIKEIFA